VFRLDTLPRVTLSALVLLHPFPLSAAVYDEDVRALSGRVRVLAPNSRGFGGSPPFDEGAPPSIDRMADDVADALDRAGATGPVVVCGVSMGGYVALGFARRHPERLAGLVLADTRAEPDSPETRASRDLALKRVEAGEVEAFVDGLLPKLTNAENRERVRQIALEQPAASVAAALVALRDRPDARPGLAGIRVPTLIIVGSEDSITPPSAAEAMRIAIPEAELLVVPGASHLVNLDRPEQFREAVGSFVERVSRSG
jgi:pimeloyl-ACP methyl ester carboxylesterase